MGMAGRCGKDGAGGLEGDPISGMLPPADTSYWQMSARSRHHSVIGGLIADYYNIFF